MAHGLGCVMALCVCHGCVCVSWLCGSDMALWVRHGPVCVCHGSVCVMAVCVMALCVCMCVCVCVMDLWVCHGSVGLTWLCVCHGSVGLSWLCGSDMALIWQLHPIGPRVHMALGYHGAPQWRSPLTLTRSKYGCVVRVVHGRKA